MQDMNWDDLRHLLAAGRGGTLAAAARRLGVDDTTVGRRLAALQASVGRRLYQRLPDGTLALTPSGERLSLIAERAETDLAALDGASSGRTISGTVRLTSVPIIVNRLLVPAALLLQQRHPDLRLELVGDARDLSLTCREADLALRLARPRTGGSRVTVRRIGALRYEVYAAASCPPREAGRLPWLTYDEAMAHLPQARWIAAAAARGGTIAVLRVSDAEALLEAVSAGLGRSLLPAALADRDPRLRRLRSGQRGAVLTRELWLLAHADLRPLARIAAVMEWLEQIVPR